MQPPLTLRHMESCESFRRFPDDRIAANPSNTPHAHFGLGPACPQVVWLTSGEQTQLSARFQSAISSPVASGMSIELKVLTMEQFIEGCRRERQALIETVANLRAAKKNTGTRNAASAQINAGLDARIFNCECSIARYELIITEAEATAPVGSP